jgi:hypothetical protein
MMWYLLYLILFIISCDDRNTVPNQASSSGSLVHSYAWATTELQQDPFNKYWSDHVRCGEDEHGLELLADIWAYSIQTGNCNWLTLEQPTLSTIQKGDIIRAEIWHFFLSALEPASARVALATKDGILAEAMELIPQPAHLMELEFRAVTSIEKNTPIDFHISNHGANSWHLLNIQINPEE